GPNSSMRGMPAGGPLTPLTPSGRAVFGMVHQPFIGERFSGDCLAAAYRGPAGNRALMVPSCPTLAEAILYTTSPRLMNAADRAAFARIEEAVRLSRYGGACYAFCMLAAGHVALIVETELKPYDVAALVPIISGAGGIVTTWNGGAPESGGRIVAAGDRRTHAAALALLNR